MKRIQYFKLFESRTAKLSEEEFYKLTKEKCSDFLNSPKLLQRIKGTYDGDYSYINPKLSFRNPLMKDEGAGGVFSSHHTLLMDNLPSWKGFPKRTQSVIGSTTISIDPAFGDHYYFIIPYNGAKFSVAPDADLWCSSCKIGEVDYQFDDYFSETFLQAGVSDTSYESMMKNLQELYNIFLEDNDQLKHDTSSYLLNIFEVSQENGYDDIKIAFDDFFAPKRFRGLGPRTETGFVLMNYSEISSIPELAQDGSIISNNKEFWTDSECLIIYCGKGNSMAKREIYKKFKEIIQDLT
jgi:hypothetical protein